MIESHKNYYPDYQSSFFFLVLPRFKHKKKKCKNLILDAYCQPSKHKYYSPT